MKKIIFKKYLFMTALALAIAGCGSNIDGYIKDVSPSQSESPSTTVASPMSLKLTPGKMNGTASGIAVQGAITTTNKTFALGSDMALSLTINRTRVSPQ